MRLGEDDRRFFSDHADGDVSEIQLHATEI
jgi:hypothetical protein